MFSVLPPRFLLRLAISPRRKKSKKIVLGKMLYARLARIAAHDEKFSACSMKAQIVVCIHEPQRFAHVSRFEAPRKDFHSVPFLKPVQPARTAARPEAGPHLIRLEF